MLCSSLTRLWCSLGSKRKFQLTWFWLQTILSVVYKSCISVLLFQKWYTTHHTIVMLAQYIPIKIQLPFKYRFQRSKKLHLIAPMFGKTLKNFNRKTNHTWYAHYAHKVRRSRKNILHVTSLYNNIVKLEQLRGKIYAPHDCIKRHFVANFYQDFFYVSELIIS